MPHRCLTVDCIGWNVRGMLEHELQVCELAGNKLVRGLDDNQFPLCNELAYVPEDICREVMMNRECIWLECGSHLTVLCNQLAACTQDIRDQLELDDSHHTGCCHRNVCCHRNGCCQKESDFA